MVLIMAITAGVAIPLFAKSYRGAQLRLASRAVITAHRHARATAVLQQSEMVLLIYTERGRVEVLKIEDDSRESEAQAFLEGRADFTSDDTPTITPEISRDFGDQVHVENIETKGDKNEVEDGVYIISYYPNGMSDGFIIQLADKGGRRMRISIDGVSGAAEVEDL